MEKFGSLLILGALLPFLLVEEVIKLSFYQIVLTPQKQYFTSLEDRLEIP